MPSQHTPSSSIGPAGVFAVLAGALLFLWPAWLNHGPLMGPDAVGYLHEGPQVVAGLLHPIAHRPPSSARSEFYVLAEYVSGATHTLWPFLIAGALLVSAFLRATMRVLGRTSSAAFLCVCAGLAVFTSLPWFASYPIADIFIGVVCLGMFLVVFGRDSMGRFAYVLCAAVTAWAITTHPTYLSIAFAVWLALCLLRLLRWNLMRRRGRALLVVGAVVLAAALAQLAMHAYLYRMVSITGNAAPYIMARLVADGPAKETLAEDCPTQHWELCRHLANLPSDDTAFLWLPDSIWLGSSAEQQKLLLAQQGALLRATLREHPRELRIMARHAWQELTDISLDDFAPFAPTGDIMESVVPGAAQRYAQSRQGRGALPLVMFSGILRGVVWLSWIVLLPLLWLANKKGARTALGLAAVTLPALLVNAALCGAVSGVYPRYETRIIWLLPLLVVALSFAGLDRRANEAL